MIHTSKLEAISRTGFLDSSSKAYTNAGKKETNLKTTGEPARMAKATNKLEESQNNRALDQALVERAKNGDKKAFGLLVEKYHRKLGRLLSRMIRDQTEVEDVVQEAFIKAYRAIHNFRGDSAFYTWLYRIGINTAKNYLVSMGRKPQTVKGIEIEDVENLDSGIEMRSMETPETSMMTKQIAETVNDTIAELPEELKTAITLRELEGLSYEDIAVIMQCPIGTVRSRIFRARETISKKLRPLLDTPDHKRW